jgi:hypothetical protein
VGEGHRLSYMQTAFPHRFPCSIIEVQWQVVIRLESKVKDMSPFLSAREMRVIVQAIALRKCNFGGDISLNCASSIKKCFTTVTQTQNSFYTYLSLGSSFNLGEQGTP